MLLYIQSMLFPVWCVQHMDYDDDDTKVIRMHELSTVFMRGYVSHCQNIFIFFV